MDVGAAFYERSNTINQTLHAGLDSWVANIPEIATERKPVGKPACA